MARMTETTNLQLAREQRVMLDAPLDIVDAADYLQVSDKTIRNWVADDTVALPVHRLGSGPRSRMRFYRSELDEWARGSRRRCSDIDPRSGVVAA